MNYPINNEGMHELRESELFVGQAYPDPLSPMGKALQKAGLWRGIIYSGVPIPERYMHLDGAPWTIGYGFTKGVKPGDKMTRAQAETRLAIELRTEYVNPILSACKIEPNENQLAGMACLAWNIGIAGFLKSTVLKAHNRGDFAAAARAFGLWNKSRGAVVEGLSARRQREAALYARPVAGFVDTQEMMPPPQRVDAESGMGRSPIIAGTGITAGASTLAVVSESAYQVRVIKESLGDWLPWALLAVAIGAAGWVIYTRLIQRRGGWA